MNKITNEEILKCMNDIIEFLDPYKCFIDMNLIKQNFKNTKFILTEAEINFYSFSEDVDIEVVVPVDECKTVIPKFKNDSSYLVLNPVCFIRNSKDNTKRIKQSIFRELIRIASIRQEVNSFGDLMERIGLSKNLYLLREEEHHYEGYENLTEAFINLVAKCIYDEIYTDKYDIVRVKDGEVIFDKYAKAYFLLAGLTLNYFENHFIQLIKTFFNNDMENFMFILSEINVWEMYELKKYIDKFTETEDSDSLMARFILKMYFLESEIHMQNQDVKEQYFLLTKKHL